VETWSSELENQEATVNWEGEMEEQVPAGSDGKKGGGVSQPCLVSCGRR
jgi:hypothetical protein